MLNYIGSQLFQLSYCHGPVIEFTLQEASVTNAVYAYIIYAVNRLWSNQTTDVAPNYYMR